MPSPHPIIQHRLLLIEALEDSDWVITRAAARLGVDRRTVYRSIERLGLKRKRPSPEFFQERARRAGSAPRRSVA